jgi:methionine-rich copper-binding protein CopC
MKRALQHVGRNSFLAYRIQHEKVPARPFVEALEPRLFLSGNVLTSLVHGRLTIHGDNAANAIVMDQAGLGAGQMRISGTGGTAINQQGGAIIVSGITRGVVLQMGEGDDSITMNSLSLPGDVSIGGRGAETLALSDVHIAGTLNIQNNSALGITSSIAGATVGKGLFIHGGAGGNTIAMQSVVVQRRTTITGGRGIDHLTIDDSAFHGAVFVCTGRGADVVQIDAHGATPASPTTFAGRVSMFLGAGNDSLQLGVNGQAGDRSVFSGIVHFRGGAGYNTLADFAASSYIGKSRYQINNFASRTPAPDTTDPTVSATTPASNATGVALNQSIAAIFSEPMDPLTITAANVTLSGPGGMAVAGTVGYVGTTTTFTPMIALAPDTTFTATITSGAKDLAGNPLAHDFVWSFTTGAAPDTTDPTVSSTTPANNATGVALNQAIAANFSEAMNPLTITSNDVRVTAPGGITVLGTVAYSGNTMTFTPTIPLASDTTFTGTITTGATDLAGNPLAHNFVWSFTTGATPDTTDPTVSSTNPANNATGVALNQSIAAIFSEAMNPLTITSANVTVTAPGGVAVLGTVSYVGSTMTFTPSSVLAADTLFTGTITTGATDLAGNPLAHNYVWSFTTGATPDTTDPTVVSTNPANDATGVALNQSIAATFSEAMNPLTITSANVTVTAPGGVVVPGTVNYAGTTLTFTPTNPLAASTIFTGTITTGATDLAGNPLANNYVWTFTTGAVPDTTPPTVASTNPADLQSNVLINEAIAATFSEAIDPTTITAATFTVTSPGDIPVAGAVNYDAQSDIATFTPTSNLAANTTFTATITGGANGVKDLAGNALVSDRIWSFTTGAQIAQAPINLGSAAAFAVMATTGITSTDPTTITGDVGLSPGSSQGIPTGDVNGSIDVDDQAVIDAQADLLSAYNDAVSRSTTSVALPGNMGGLTFTPGLYTNSSSVIISGSGPNNNVTLDAQGNPNAIFIFKIGSTLTTGTGAQVILAGGAKASNVFWQVGTSATLNTTTIFKGNLLAAVSITVNNGSAVEGRLLAGSDSDGAVTIDQSVVSVPTT